MLKRWIKMMEQRLRRMIYRGLPAPDDAQARDQTHKLANEVQQLDAVTRRITCSPNPWREFVTAVRGRDEHYKRREL